MGAGVLKVAMTRDDAKTRVRKRIRARLDELGMTGRELANAGRPPKSDAWISGVLSGAQGLQLEDLDWVAEKLRLSPSELVREDKSELRELRPHEMKALRHYQSLPSQIQDRLLRVFDYFAAATPDQEGARFLEAWKDMSTLERRELREYLETLRKDRLRRSDGPAIEPRE